MDLPSFRVLLLGVNGNPLTDSLLYVFLYVTLVVSAILITSLTGNITALSIGILFFAVLPILIGYTNKGLMFSQMIISVPIFFAFVILSLQNSGPPDYGDIPPSYGDWVHCEDNRIPIGKRNGTVSRQIYQGYLIKVFGEYAHLPNGKFTQSFLNQSRSRRDRMH